MLPTIFALDGNPEILKIYADLLGDGASVSVFPTISDFEAGIRESPVVDLLVTELDLVDGQLDACGESTIEWLTSTNVLVVSRSNDIEGEFDRVKSWANDYLSKPLNNTLFVSKCQQLIGNAKLYMCDSLRMKLTSRNRTSEALTANEFRLVNFLSLSEDYKITVAAAVDEIWGMNVPLARLHALLSRLRPKIRPLDLEIAMDKSGQISIQSSIRNG